MDDLQKVLNFYSKGDIVEAHVIRAIFSELTNNLGKSGAIKAIPSKFKSLKSFDKKNVTELLNSTNCKVIIIEDCTEKTQEITGFKGIDYKIKYFANL